MNTIEFCIQKFPARPTKYLLLSSDRQEPPKVFRLGGFGRGESGGNASGAGGFGGLILGGLRTRVGINRAGEQWQVVSGYLGSGGPASACWWMSSSEVAAEERLPKEYAVLREGEGACPPSDALSSATRAAASSPADHSNDSSLRARLRSR